MLKHKGMRLIALLSSLVCLAAVAIPASAKVCQTHSQGNFSSTTGYTGPVINGGVGNGMYSGNMSASIHGNFRYANDKTDYEFRSSNSGSGYYTSATYTARKVVDTVTGFGDFFGSAGGTTYSKTLNYD